MPDWLDSFSAAIGVLLLWAVKFGPALLTGQALAKGWRSAWQLIPYCILLGAAARFMAMVFADGDILDPASYLADTLVATIVACAAYRFTLVRKIVAQYPWLYRRSSLFHWHRRDE